MWIRNTDGWKNIYKRSLYDDYWAGLPEVYPLPPVRGRQRLSQLYLPNKSQVYSNTIHYFLILTLFRQIFYIFG